jgi:hypothetical protein
MIINTAPQNEAVMSNVGQIGEFRIRNSAKAFSILSSGLYANKIRAIIRELSCNAVDSHTAAGKQDTPFDVHLPTQLEPWFSIRDYGTGLNHDQVTNIYTTYFESTKTESNEFIGALGLGSKSPFSYTDNFTVTAVKDGRKGIYTAFINEAGVPSIAQMMQEDTDEPSGVEVKFSVNDRYDFDKFRQEARQVYTYFKLRPVVNGDFKFTDVEYDTKDIIPGVHSYKDSRRCVAIMGNIAYPIEVPQAEQSLGDLRQLLGCGLEMHFAIGELDFQASREGLSYIPTTIESIRKKLEALNAQLAVHIAVEADAIPNLWERAVHLQRKYHNSLWTTAIKKYVQDTKLPTFDDNRYGGTMAFKLGIDDLANKYNINIRGFNYAKHTKAYPNRKHDMEHKQKAGGGYDYIPYWSIVVETNIQFVVNDTNVGATERAKFHYRATKPDTSTVVFVLDKADKTKAMNTKAFFKAICNPPADRIVKASALQKKERADNGLGKNVTILCLQERGSGGYYREREMVWRDAGKSDSFDASQTYYYLPLSGFEAQSKFGSFDVKQFYNDLKDCGLNGLKTTIHGVRKGDIEFIRTQKNWVNIETYVAQELSKPIDNKLIMSLVLQAIDGFSNISYNSNVLSEVKNALSPYQVFVTKLKGFEKIRYNEQSLKRLCERYAQGTTFNPEAEVQKYVSECRTVNNRYPLLQYLRSIPSDELANYINIIDTQKGI